MRKIIALLAAGGAVAAMWLSPSSASADSAPGGREACNPGAFCLYYNSPTYGWGAFTHVYSVSEMSLSGVYFNNYGNGSGYGQRVWHNAAAWVNNTGNLVWVCSSQASQCFMALPGDAGALPSWMKNLDETIWSSR